MSQKDFTICAGGGDPMFVWGAFRDAPPYLQKLVDLRCFVGIQGYSQGADLTARGCGVCTWIIASILPFQTPTVTHQ